MDYLILSMAFYYCSEGQIFIKSEEQMLQLSCSICCTMLQQNLVYLITFCQCMYVMSSPLQFHVHKVHCGCPSNVSIYQTVEDWPWPHCKAAAWRNQTHTCHRLLLFQKTNNFCRVTKSLFASWSDANIIYIIKSTYRLRVLRFNQVGKLSDRQFQMYENWTHIEKRASGPPDGFCQKKNGSSRLENSVYSKMIDWLDFDWSFAHPRANIPPVHRKSTILGVE